MLSIKVSRESKKILDNIQNAPGKFYKGIADASFAHGHNLKKYAIKEM